MHNDKLNGFEKHRIGLISAVTAACLFGLSTIFTKTGVSDVSVLTLISWRFVIAFTIMTILILIGVFKVELRNKPLIGLLSIAIFAPAIYFLAEGNGLQLTTASEGGTILAMTPVVTLLLSTLILKEYPTLRQTASIMVSVFGVIIIVLSKSIGANFSILGYLFLFLAIFSDSMCMILTRKYLVYSPTERVYAMTAIGAILFTPMAIVEHFAAGTLTDYLVLPLHNSGFLIAVLYLGAISSVAGFTLCAVGIRYIGPNKVTSLSGISTIISVFVGIVFLKESFTILQGVGTLLILFGAYNANRKNDRTVKSNDNPVITQGD